MNFSNINILEDLIFPNLISLIEKKSKQYNKNIFLKVHKEKPNFSSKDIFEYLGVSIDICSFEKQQNLYISTPIEPFSPDMIKPELNQYLSMIFDDKADFGLFKKFMPNIDEAMKLIRQNLCTFSNELQIFLTENNCVLFVSKQQNGTNFLGKPKFEKTIRYFLANEVKAKENSLLSVLSVHEIPAINL